MLSELTRKLVPVAVIAALVAGVYGLSRLAIDPELRTRNAELSAELVRIQARNARLQGQIEVLKSEIKRLRTQPEESLYHARTGLGLIFPGEVVYRFAGTSPGADLP